MQIFHWHKGFSFPEQTAVVIGNFDGVHRGHQAMIARLFAQAEKRSLVPMVMSFYPHPRVIVGNETPAILSTMRDRAFWLKHYGVKNWLLVPFTSQFRQTSPERFIEQDLHEKLKVRYLLVGDDFRFGYRGAGDFDLLQSQAQRFNYEVESLPTICADGERISSSAIRQALAKHQISKATDLLGHALTFTGRVHRGAGRGRLMQTRTVNLHVPLAWCLPDGVYVIKLQTFSNQAQTLWGVANLGGAPTFGSQQRKLEAHVFAELGEQYGQIVQVSFYHYLREVKTFPDADALQQQIQKDIQAAQVFIAAQA
ncbi:riboflavin biosynthesis protein RibF [Suttonella ornithocola]|uniref:Riboflavin biosynthesis protein n=1 Tax=Suttonella ornithocola TaxID=279832 RepID=A0A380MPA3_9GAMM|nr:riboflavin biosynthesis protein RibF [Suttonella ornithocola]SUO94449.1 Riboflavin biosynthesis protein ribF [Suttonella ornithocola]